MAEYRLWSPGEGEGYSHVYFIRRLGPASTAYPINNLEYQAYPKIYLKLWQSRKYSHSVH